MKYRNFGNNKVSEIGLGTWQLGADWGDVDDSTAEKVLATAVENGVNFLIPPTAMAKVFQKPGLAGLLKHYLQKWLSLPNLAGSPDLVGQKISHRNSSVNTQKTP